MQKKIYPFYLVPCLLVCLALGFLMSCGDDTSSTSNTPSGSSGGQQHEEPPSNNRSDVVIADIDTSWRGVWKLLVTGRVYLTTPGTDTTRIKKIEIKLVNQQTNTEVNIPVNGTVEDFDTDYDLKEGQAGYDFSDLNNCDITRGPLKIYVYVYLSNNSSMSATDKSAEFTFTKEPYEGCRNDLVITTSVNPPGSGTVAVNPSGPTYTKGQSVTVTATPSSGDYTFFNWTDDGIVVSDCPNNPCTVTMDNNKNLTANFSQSFTLVKDEVASKNYKSGETILDVVKFTGGGFEAQGGARIAENFKKADGTYDLLNQTTKPLQDTFNSSEFVPAEENLTEIDYMGGAGPYFVVKSGTSWRNWYLISAKNTSGCSTADTPKCAPVTVWKVQ